MILKHFILAASALTLAACSHTTQYTSGKDYLNRYDKSAATLSASNGTIESDIRNIAAIEPDLQFPARIGLARIERGRLISIPQDESKRITPNMTQEMSSIISAAAAPVSIWITFLFMKSPIPRIKPAMRCKLQICLFWGFSYCHRAISKSIARPARC